MDAALALVVDRSGSMYSIANDVRGSVKQFIGDQKKLEGTASLRVAQFDHTYEVIHNVKDAREVDEEAFATAYSPRGSTALLDAIGRTITEMKEQLDKFEPAAEKPKRVVIAVITDGQENSSSEYKLDQIKKMVTEHEALGWDFLFLGASLDAIDVAASMGFSKTKSSAYDTSNISSCMGNLSAKFSQARQNENIEFTQDERDSFMQTPAQTQAATPPATATAAATEATAAAEAPEATVNAETAQA